MHKFKLFQPFRIFLLLALCLPEAYSANTAKIAVLAFELKDMTLAPGIPAEVERTATIKPLLERELAKLGYRIVEIPAEDQQHNNAGVGYLFDHSDSAAKLAEKYGVDYVIVGRLHKPSFLFVYMMAHLVDVKKARLVGNFLSEVKGGEKKLTQKGVENLSDNIDRTLVKKP